MNQITTQVPVGLARFDPSRAAATLSLPEWAISRLACLEGGRALPTIPASASLTPEERGMLETRRGDLRRALRRCPANDRDEAKAVLVIVTDLLLAYANGSASERSSEAKGRAYLGALEDIPSWCVAEAVKRWHRGAAGGGHSYEFAPAPAVLRAISEGIKTAADGQMAALGRLLAAEVRPELTDEERAANVARFVALMSPAAGEEAPPE